MTCRLIRAFPLPRLTMPSPSSRVSFR
jgi:hypothetical protein